MDHDRVRCIRRGRRGHASSWINKGAEVAKGPAQTCGGGSRRLSGFDAESLADRSPDQKVHHDLGTASAALSRISVSVAPGVVKRH